MTEALLFGAGGGVFLWFLTIAGCIVASEINSGDN